MFAYYLELALRSFRRSRVLFALMVLAIGLGIGASMTMTTVLHVITANPLPDQGARLFRPHLDPLPLDFAPDGEGPDPSNNLTFVDAMALLARGEAAHQAAMAGGSLLAWPQRPGAPPVEASGRYTTPDLFPMFGVPFVSGSAWSAADGRARARVVVLARSLARKLLGPDQGVGSSVRLGDNDFRVVGIVDDWQPSPMFYADTSAKAFGDPDAFFLPLRTAVDLRLDVTSNFARWGEQGEDPMTSATTSWVQFWVELPDAAAVSRYARFLADYTAEQRRLGRFERGPERARLDSLEQWLRLQDLVPRDVRLQTWLAYGFLLVCMVNIVALLLAMFLRRSSEISIRRALGARRRDIFLQFGVESAAIGMAGGLLGLVIAQAGLWSVRQRPDDYARLADMDAAMALATILLAIAASVLAGLLPAWRACRVPPALQLKTL